MSEIPRSNWQNKTLWALFRQLGFDAQAKENLIAELTAGRTQSTRELTFDEAATLITRLRRSLFAANRSPGSAHPAAHPSQRTIQQRRKALGIVQLATATHKDFMRRLARKRGLNSEDLEELSARVNAGVRVPRLSTEVNRIIEALKDMNRRDEQAKHNAKLKMLPARNAHAASLQTNAAAQEIIYETGAANDTDSIRESAHKFPENSPEEKTAA